FFSSRRRHTRFSRDWSSDVCSSDLPFGQVPRFYASPLITDVAQAKSAAASLLKRSLGLPYSVSFGTIVNPALEPLDPIRITYPEIGRASCRERAQGRSATGACTDED